MVKANYDCDHFAWVKAVTSKVMSVFWHTGKNAEFEEIKKRFLNDLNNRPDYAALSGIAENSLCRGATETQQSSWGADLVSFVSSFGLDNPEH